MISTESGYLKDLANNINLTERHSLGPLDVLMLIDVILTQRGESIEYTDTKPDELAQQSKAESQSPSRQGPQQVDSNL